MSNLMLVFAIADGIILGLFGFTVLMTVIMTNETVVRWLAKQFKQLEPIVMKTIYDSVKEPDFDPADEDIII